jgi:hypothetical protein
MAADLQIDLLAYKMPGIIAVRQEQRKGNYF